MGTVYKIYCDESRQNGEKYKLMGSIWIKKDYGWHFVNEFHNRCIRNFGVLPAHMKWTKVPNKIHDKYFGFYILLIDLFFEYSRQERMFFKTIIADSSYDFKHPLYHSGDPEAGFYKLYYQLLLNSLRRNERYHIRIADRTVSNKRFPLSQTERLDELMQCLNNGFTKKT